MIEKEDILDRSFEKKIFGYDKVEVEYFQKMIAKEFEKLEAEIEELKQVEKKYEEIGGKESEEIIKEAESKAEEIISEAEEKAENIVSKAEEKKEKLQNHINEIEVKKASLINSISKIVDQQKDFINTYYNREEENN